MAEAQTPRTPTVEEFLQAQFVPRFHEQVQAAEQRLAAAQGEVEDLRAARGTIAWEISGAVPLRYVDIADGAMKVVEKPASEPFMTVSQTEADWVRFTSGMAGLFGGDPRRPFGKSRIDRVRTLRGAVRFIVSDLPGGETWTCVLSFGGGPRPAEPQTTITISADAAAKMQAGQLDPQMAFMQGQVKLAGDAGFAMQLGMALLM